MLNFSYTCWGVVLYFKPFTLICKVYKSFALSFSRASIDSSFIYRADKVNLKRGLLTKQLEHKYKYMIVVD